MFEPGVLILGFSLDVQEIDNYYFEHPWTGDFAADLTILDSKQTPQKVFVDRDKPLRAGSLLMPGQYKVYLKLSNTERQTFLLSVRVFSSKALLNHERSESQTRLFIYGFGFSYAAYSAFLFLLTRKRYYLYHALYLLSIGYVLTLASFHSKLHSSLLQWTFLIIMNFILMFLLSDSILILKHFHPRMRHTTVILLSFGSVFIIVQSLLRLDHRIQGLGFMLCLTAVFIVLISSYKRMLSGYKPAVFLAIGWSFLILAYGLNAYHLFFDFVHPIFIWLPYLAYPIDALLFSVAVFYRSRDAEQRAIQDKVHALTQLEKVVYKHQMKMIVKGTSLEDTMPTGTEKACGMYFKIVSRTKIEHILASQFHRKLSARCQQLMNQGYDGEQLKARAYRIKEMGDSFLCSVGYPFRSLSQNPANDAVTLAEDFAAALSEESQILQAESPIVCCIGIAIDNISGFYPESGTKEYDVNGPAATLAMCYAELRKHIEGDTADRSLIVIHDWVYHSLSMDFRRRFKGLDLASIGLVIRDDPGATRLYYCYLDDSAVSANNREVAVS